MKKGDRIDEIYEVVEFIKDSMVRGFAHVEDRFLEVRSELSKVKDRVFAIEGKLDDINKRIDNEVDKRKQLDVRASKLETKVFGK